MDIKQRKYPYAIHMPSGRFNHGRNKPESGIGVVVAPVVGKLDSSDAINTDHSIAITNTSTIVNIAPTLTPFFANCLSSSLSTKNIAIPPRNPKNMGNRYHILEPRFFCCSDIFLSHFFHARYKLVINNLFVNLSNIAIYAARHHYLTSQSPFFGLNPFRPARRVAASNEFITFKDGAGIYPR